MNSVPLPRPWLDAITKHISCERVEEIFNASLLCRQNGVVYPPAEKVFNAFELTPYESVKAVILGQDPYFNEGEAHGLAFSVPDGVKLPPTLRNIFKEYADDLNREIPQSSDLTNWAKGGVLLLNAILTVNAGMPESHKNIGWQEFTDAVIKAVNDKTERVSFILWGNYAKGKTKYISSRHNVIAGVHPSPLAAYRGFFGSKPFSKAQTGNWVWPEI